MKKFIIEIIIATLGVLGIAFNDPIAKGIGFILLVSAVIIFAVRYSIKKSGQTHQKPTAKQAVKPSNTSSAQLLSSPDQKAMEETTIRVEKKEREAICDQQVILLADHTKMNILDINDIQRIANIKLRFEEMQYISKKLVCPLFGGTVDDVCHKIAEQLLSEQQIISVLTFGTENLKQRFFSSYDTESWTMPSVIFEHLLKNDSMQLLTLVRYTSDKFLRLLNELEPHELFGYRTMKRSPDEQPENTVDNLLTGEQIPYYEDADTDVVYIAEQRFGDSQSVRKTAFDKMFSISFDMVETIKRLDSMTEEEVRRIISRGNHDEIDTMFERSDSNTLVDYIPSDHAIKVVLGVISSDYSDHIHENFDFENVSASTWRQVIEELTPDELAGYRMKPLNDNERPEGNFTIPGQDDIPYYQTGDHDFIGLLEEHGSDNDEIQRTIRALAFQKLIKATLLTQSVETWNNIMEEEVAAIMARQKKDEIETMFERDDSDTIIERLPDVYIIKARLGLFDFGDIDDLNDEFENRMNEDAFKTLVNKLVENM